MSVPRASSNPSLLPPPPVSASFLSTLVPPPLSLSPPPPPPLPLVNEPSPPPPRTLLRREKTWTAVPAAPRMLPSPPSCRPRRPPASPRLSLQKWKKNDNNNKNTLIWNSRVRSPKCSIHSCVRNNWIVEWRNLFRCAVIRQFDIC